MMHITRAPDGWSAAVIRRCSVELRDFWPPGEIGRGRFFASVEQAVSAWGLPQRAVRTQTLLILQVGAGDNLIMSRRKGVAWDPTFDVGRSAPRTAAPMRPQVQRLLW